MTLRELEKYNNIKMEISQIESNINEIETTTIGSFKLNDISISKSGSNSNPTERIAIKLATLREKLNFKKEKLIEAATEIEDFLEKVDDSEIRIIIRKRFLECKTWNEISKEIISERTTPYYKLKRFLNRGDNNDNKNKKIF